MDWAEEKYDVSSHLFTCERLQTCYFVAVSNIFLFVTETPHCSDQNGSESPLFIHPTSNVLDPV